MTAVSWGSAIANRDIVCNSLFLGLYWHGGVRQPICRVKEIKHVSRLRVVPRTEQSVGVVARVDIPKYLKNKSPIFPSQFYPQFIRLVSAAALLIRLVGYPVISSCEFFPELANIHISVFCI